MKNRHIVLTVLFVLTAGLVFGQAGFKSLGFIIPQINGKGNVFGPQTGEVIYDSSDGGFYGYNQVSEWILLGGGTTGLPAGSIVPFAGSAAPAGYLVADGSAVSRSTYAVLFSVIGTTYGSGDGVTSFNLPNLKGVFLRGAGSQSVGGVTYTGTLAVTQMDQLQGHQHNQNGATTTVGNPGGGTQVNTTSGPQWYITPQATSTPISDGANGIPRVGQETRPINVSVTYLIKI